MALAYFQRRCAVQPREAPVLSQRFASRIAWMQVGGWIYDGFAWSRFVKTSQQTVGHGRRGVGVLTTADSTPDTYTVRGAATLDAAGLVFVGRKTAETSYDYFFEVGASSSRLVFGTGGGIGVDNFSREVFGVPGLPASATNIFPWHGAAVWRTSLVEGVTDTHIDGGLRDSGAMTGIALPQIDSVTVGGRIGLSNRNWRGVQELSAIVARMTRAEAAAISANPWGELFAPRRIFVPMSAGVSVPTLSAATYMPGSLTSSGFRPRVTAS